MYILSFTHSLILPLSSLHSFSLTHLKASWRWWYLMTLSFSPPHSHSLSHPPLPLSLPLTQPPGKLAVVVSDDSLAFGVNMPFRTCVFTGQMNGELTPLMAQQMSGRAGRRGLDTQGNLVYVGAPASFIRSLMIGKVTLHDTNNTHTHTHTPSTLYQYSL